MRLLYCGDVIGKAGRNVIIRHLNEIKSKFQIDVTIVNGENSSHGYGINPTIAKNLLNAGADILTTGNHIWQNKDIYPFLDQSDKIVRPINYPTTLPGKGYQILEINNKKILVIQVLGRVYMPAVNSLVHPIDELLNQYKLGENIDAIFVDIHAEATAEKVSLGYYLDGKVSLVAGTHTHIPTADYRILKNGTGYITDVGMCGDFDSIIGFEPQTPIERLCEQHNIPNRLNPANGKEHTIWGVMVDIDNTGKCTNISQIKEVFNNL